MRYTKKKIEEILNGSELLLYEYNEIRNEWNIIFCKIKEYSGKIIPRFSIFNKKKLFHYFLPYEGFGFVIENLQEIIDFILFLLDNTDNKKILAIYNKPEIAEKRNKILEDMKNKRESK